jgi:hypothetical protein
MFRLLLIISIVGYVFYKVGGMFFRAGAASQQFRPDERKNVNVDPPAKKEKKSGAIKGGDYVDYEEVK